MWEPVDSHEHTEHLNMGPGKPSVWQRAEVRDTVRRSLVASESLANTQAWMKRVDEALAWLDSLEANNGQSER